MMPITRRALATVLIGSTGLMTAVISVGAGSAEAATVSANFTGGSLALVSTPNFPSFSATLNGTDQAVTVNSGDTIDVGDATGSGTGWKVQGTSTTFATASPVNTLPTTATHVTGVSVACDSSVTCTTASTNVSYPYTLPAGGSAPTATTFYNATANTGMGNQTITPTWTLVVPGNAFAGTYSSTWTISLVSGP